MVYRPPIGTHAKQTRCTGSSWATMSRPSHDPIALPQSATSTIIDSCNESDGVIQPDRCSVARRHVASVRCWRQ